MVCKVSTNVQEAARTFYHQGMSIFVVNHEVIKVYESTTPTLHTKVCISIESHMTLMKLMLRVFLVYYDLSSYKMFDHRH